MQKVRKAVIPCGGLGTRFLPITKSVPKELLPVIDTPVLSLITAELVASGITQIIIVLSEGKESIREYFSPAPKLERALQRSGRQDLFKQVKDAGGGAEYFYVYQKSPRGSGDAVLCAEELVAGEPFALCWGDDVVYGEVPAIRQLLNVYERTGGTVVGVQPVLGREIEKYGAIIPDGEPEPDGAVRMKGIIEKPKMESAPGFMAALGRYIVDSSAFDYIRATLPAANGEIQFTDALNAMAREGRVYAAEYKGRRYDMGDKFGAVTATTEYALRSAFGKQYLEYLKELVEGIGKE